MLLFLLPAIFIFTIIFIFNYLILFFEGVATQQVITIPVSQLAGNQIVQLVASNGQIFTTTLASLQAMSQPVPVSGISNPSMWSFIY